MGKKCTDDFKEILDFLSKQSNQAPKIVKTVVIVRLDIIKTNALICEIDKLKDDANKEFRAFIVYSYRITYQIKKEVKIFVLSEYVTQAESLWVIDLRLL